jgi:hypothetical protein
MIHLARYAEVPGVRKLIVGIVTVTLVTWAFVITDLASGGGPDPPALRAAATLLDGAWRFHVGDDPRWADVSTDDTEWETLAVTTATWVCPITSAGGWRTVIPAIAATLGTGAR